MNWTVLALIELYSSSHTWLGHHLWRVSKFPTRSSTCSQHLACLALQGGSQGATHRTWVIFSETRPQGRNGKLVMRESIFQDCPYFSTPYTTAQCWHWAEKSRSWSHWYPCMNQRLLSDFSLFFQLCLILEWLRGVPQPAVRAGHGWSSLNSFLKVIHKLSNAPVPQQ